MHILASETISDVDSMAHAYVVDHWTPSTIEGQKERDKLDRIEGDLNLLDMTSGGGHYRAYLPGYDDAVMIVQTDLAMKASAIMKAVPRDELENMRNVDDSVALDPVRFDIDDDEKARDAAHKADWEKRSLASRGAPPPSLTDRGPISDETASRIAEVANEIIADGKWNRKKDLQFHTDTVVLLDRIGRLDRTRREVIDPDVRAAYDLMKNDMALKVAGNMNHGLSVGAVKTKSFEAADLRMLRDPHNPDGRGVAGQAVGITAEPTTAAKGPAQTPDLVMVSRGTYAER